MATNLLRGFWPAAVLLMLALPLLLSPAATGIATNMLIAGLFALAFNLLIGQGGMLSFGHAAYFAVGAFATVHAMMAVDRGQLWLPTPLLPLAGGFAGLVVGAIAGYFATLRSGVYFSMVTLAIAELLHSLAPNMANIFGGEAGLSSMRQPWLGFSFGSEHEVYALVLAWTVLAVVALYLYTHTPFGRITVALRENERRVAFLGFNPHLTKVLVFTVSAGFAGLSGGLLAVSNESANYVLFGLGYSANVVLHTFIGGSSVFLGPALGAATLTLFGSITSDLTRLWLLYQGLIFVAVMMYLPNGIGGLLRDQAALARQTSLFRLVRANLAMAAALALICAGLVYVCEAVSILLSRDYLAQVERLGQVLPINVFGRELHPQAVGTWAVPAGLLAAGALLLGPAIHLARAIGSRVEEEKAAEAEATP